jgi:hypothetical protein
MPLYVEYPGSSGIGLGGTPSTCLAMAAIHSGVVPQQPPTRFSQPLRANAGELAEHLRGVVHVPLEAAEAVGHAGVGIAAHPRLADVRQGLDRRPHLVDAHRAVQADAQRVEVRHRVVERVDRLGGERAVVVLEDRPGDHDGEPPADLLEIGVDGEQAGLHDQRVERRLGQQQVDARLDQGGDLHLVVGDHLVERHVAAARVVDVDAHRQLLLGRADAAGHEPGLVRVPPRVVVGRPAGDLDRPDVQLADVLVEAELLERERVVVERVGLDDVRARLQVSAVDVLDHLGLGQDEDFRAVLQPDRVVREPAPSVILLGGLIPVDHRPHRAVEDDDAFRQDFLKARRCGANAFIHDLRPFQ